MVTGFDQGVPPLSSIVSVQISVGDVNDNAPRFSQNVYTTSVPEFLATGASAFRVSCSYMTVLLQDASLTIRVYFLHNHIICRSLLKIQMLD